MSILLLITPLLTAVLSVVGLCLLFGSVLGFAAARFRVEGDPLVDQVEALLPQSQCGQCGHPGCRLFAESLINGDSNLTQCPSASQSALQNIADILGIQPADMEGAQSSGPSIAYIDETDCYGCGMCLRACPVDAIIGANKQLHTVFRDECTGCGLCVSTCSKNCISMQAQPVTTQNWRWKLPQHQPGIELIPAVECKTA